MEPIIQIINQASLKQNNFKNFKYNSFDFYDKNKDSPPIHHLFPPTPYTLRLSTHPRGVYKECVRYKKMELLELPLSNEIFQILKILEKEGYLTIICINKKNKIKIQINKIKKIQLISKPSRKVYVKHHHLTPLYKFGLGTSIIKTPQGFFTDIQCIWKKIGGEWILKIY